MAVSMGKDLFRDEDLSESEIDCRVCGSKIIIYSIPLKPASFYLENESEMLNDMNEKLERFYCGLCNNQYYSITKVMKIFTRRRD